MKLAKMPDGTPEVFHTLQGEGRNVGAPSVFLRAALCNLHCVWCDTDYTWNWEGTGYAHEKDRLPHYQKYKKEEQIIEVTAPALVELVRVYPARRYVFTGGEPLLQEKAWVELMELLLAEDPGCFFEVETNGTQRPGGDFTRLVHQFNVSPKLANSGVVEKLRYRPEVLHHLHETGKADFKFVVGGKEDLEEIIRLVEAVEIAPDHVFLMPRANSVEELEARQGMVAEQAARLGFRYSDRLHLRLYGVKRGV